VAQSLASVDGKSIHVFNARTGKVLLKENSNATSAGWSPDGKCVNAREKCPNWDSHYPIRRPM